MIDRRSDSYLLEFSNQESFLGEVRDMDSNSTWLQGISSRSLVVEAVEGPLLAREYAELHGLDYVTAEDTGKHQQLALSFMDPHGKTNYGFLRETAYEGLAYTAAGTGGASLPLLEPFELEQDINFRLHAMNVKDKKLLLLDRYGKISAIHSGADSGYAVMPITELLECSMDMLKRRFGTPVFHYGMNSHDVTTAIWTLPEKQEELLRFLTEEMHSGATLYEATGAYNRQKRTEIITIVNRNEYSKLLNWLHREDPNAFVTVYTVGEIIRSNRANPA